MSFKIKSINKPQSCQYCDGTGKSTEYFYFSKRANREKCEKCNGRGALTRKYFFKYGDYEFEAMIVNKKGSFRKQNKWCVEVFQTVYIQDEYEEREIVESSHLYMLDGWGKSLSVAWKKAIKNVIKYNSKAGTNEQN